jgi:hypothetical protein
MMDKFTSSNDYDEGKVMKYRRINPIGENIYLCANGAIARDEDKIINVQRIFKHNLYKPGGMGYMRALEKFQSCTTQSTNLETKSNELPVRELPGNPDA